MDEPQITPEIQADLQKLQALSGQVQAVAQQKQQMELRLSEVKRAHEAVKELDDDAPIFRTVGGLMVKDNKAAAEERLSDEEDTLEIRVKRLAGQEESMTAEFNELQTKLQSAFGA